MTRQRILTAAVEVFVDVGYPECTLAQVTDRSGMTKGALYHHFASKEEIAAAIIKAAGVAMAKHLAGVMTEPMPAIERLIRASLMGAELIESDAAIRTSCLLSCDFGGFVARPKDIEDAWIDAVAGVVADAIDERSVRADSEPRNVAQLICTTIIGAEVLSRSHPALSMTSVLQQHWGYLLFAIARPECVDYWTEFVARRRVGTARASDILVPSNNSLTTTG